MKRKALITLSLLFFTVSLVSAAVLLVKGSEYQKGEDIYYELTKFTEYGNEPEISTENIETVKSENEENNKEDLNIKEVTLKSHPDVNFEGIYEIAPDVKAWLYLEKSSINYPVVQSEDNDYYLRRLPNGSENTAGSLFFDYRNNANISDRNTVIYGHNMQNGSMFADILKFNEQTYYESHKEAYLITPTGNYKISFFSGFVTDLNSDAWQIDFSSDEEFSLWLSEMRLNSAFESNITPNVNDKIITLSTCSYDFTDARFVLMGVINGIN